MCKHVRVVMEISGVQANVVVDTAVKSADVNTNNEVEKRTQNVESQTDTESSDAASQPTEGGRIGSNVDVTA